jgi:hypothetical protein
MRHPSPFDGHQTLMTLDGQWKVKAKFGSRRKVTT